MFKEDKSISAYVDDIVVQSKLKKDHISDLERAFTNLRNTGLRLSPEKCIFGVSKGKILGCLVSARGIEANPEKNPSNPRHEASHNQKTCPKAHREDGSAEQVHLQIR
jgi:hypothetical protein